MYSIDSDIGASDRVDEVSEIDLEGLFQMVQTIAPDDMSGSCRPLERHTISLPGGEKRLVRCDIDPEQIEAAAREIFDKERSIAWR